MSVIYGWFYDIELLEHSAAHFFDNFMKKRSPPIDVHENNKEFTVNAELPVCTLIQLRSFFLI